MGLVQPENPACGGACYRGRTTYPHRNVIPFGVTGMSVKAIEPARKNKRVEFVPLVDKKRGCRHVGHSTGGRPTILRNRQCRAKQIFSELHCPNVPVRVRSTAEFAKRRMSALLSIFFPKADEGYPPRSSSAIRKRPLWVRSTATTLRLSTASSVATTV